MAISQKIQDSFNAQLDREFYSSHLYLSMAGYFEAEGLKGFAHWMRVQADEERTHAIKFYDFIIQRGAKVVLGKIDKPPHEWKSTLDAFEATLKHEEMVTGFVNELVDISLGERDHAAHSFLRFFVDEQVEEEESVNEIIGKIKLVEKSAGGLYMLDNEMGGRVASAPEPAP